MDRIRALVLAGVCGAALAACGGSNGTPSAEPDGGARKTPKSVLEQSAFASCTDFKAYYANALAEEYFSGYAYNRNCFGCDPATLESVEFAQGDAVAAPSTPQDAPQREVTQTNTQEAGVDEADLIEASPDGQYLYVLRRESRELLVVDTGNLDDLQILTRISLSDSKQPTGMFLDSQTQRLVVLLTPDYVYYLHAPAVSDAGFADAAKSSIAPAYFEQATDVQFYDVSDPATPVQLETLSMDGQYLDARRIDDRVHLITQFGFPYPAALYNDATFNKLAYEDYPSAYADGDQARMDALTTDIRAHIESAVNALDVSELLPRLGTVASGQQTLACDHIQRPAISTRMGLLMISSINTDGSALSTLGTINNAWQLYASTNALYLSQHSGGWWFDPEQTQQTAIYRYDISSGSAIPDGLGVIDGWFGNRYQMSEFENHLRVVATEARPADEPGAAWVNHHHLSILSATSMALTGMVEDFVDVNEKPRETIRAARFVGDNAYVVTFEQIDPLFTFDLSDPTQPEKKGELEIPGFSTYMHPLGTDHLLTIGRNAGEGGIGTGRGFHLQIFDVSDLSAPQVIASSEPELDENDYAFSLAEHDPHAFTYSEVPILLSQNDQDGLLSLPVQIGSPDPERSLSGFMAMRIGINGSAGSIEEYARIDHKDSGEGDQGCPSDADELPPEGCNGFAPIIYNQPLRSVIINEQGPLLSSTSVLTLSSSYLKSLDASGDSPAERDSLDLRP